MAKAKAKAKADTKAVDLVRALSRLDGSSTMKDNVECIVITKERWMAGRKLIQGVIKKL